MLENRHPPCADSTCGARTSRLLTRVNLKIVHVSVQHALLIAHLSGAIGAALRGPDEPHSEDREQTYQREKDVPPQRICAISHVANVVQSWVAE